MKLPRNVLVAVVFLAALALLLARNHLRDAPSYDGKSLSFYLRDFNHPKDSAEYGKTTNALFHLGQDAAPHLARALGKKDPKILKVLWTVLPDAVTRYLPDPMEAWVVRNEAYFLLKNLGPTAKPAVPQLIRLLEDNNPEVRDHAAEILGGIGPGSPAAVTALVTAIQRKTISELTAVPALHRLGYRAKEAAPGLADLVRTGSTPIKLQAANCLSLIGPDASPAIPALIELLRDEESRVRPAAVHALVQVGRSNPAVVAALTN